MTRTQAARFEINCDGDAFTGEPDGNLCRKADEIARILRRAADRLQEQPERAANGYAIPLLDVNGNRVGNLVFFEEVLP